MAIWRLKCYYEIFVQGSTLGIRFNFCAKNPPRRPNVSHFMRVPNIIFMSLVVSIIMSCGENTNAESEKLEYKARTLVDVVDDVQPPPDELTPQFKSIKEWMFTICDGNKPETSIGRYEVGFFESPNDCTMFLVGLNKYDSGDTSYTRIEFEPANMYFKLPNIEYKNVDREELIKKLATELKDFTNTTKFKSSFLANADNIVLVTNGQTIWSK